MSLLHLRVRQIGYGLRGLFDRSEAQRGRMEMLRIAARWNRSLDPLRFVESGEEPPSGYEPLVPAVRPHNVASPTAP